ncbi:uncharacterized protein LOC126778132 isoform X2 [Nymphalis io]|uniref:uncharacterized protein LOC126778132 isoform X2 n=1 Tax=Inachis io TaxID=171585 RepID=UPI0021688F55|nr:uncharacterized protein LOC126778132 isoform X2 [Nymphalis io]
MAPVYSKNAILEGCVSSDFFCLVCEIYFTSAVNCDKHISGANHKEKMNSIKYVEKFEEDGIKKIRNKYFCELCNQLISVFARVKMHVNEPSHIKKKHIGWLKRIDNVVVAFDSIMIDDTSWQGLCDNSCTICNMEYDDEVTHKNSPTHMLNLIQSKVEFDKNKNLYRKVDESSVQCLTCNLVQALDTNHFDSPQHTQMIQAACDGYKAMTQQKNLNVNVNENSKKYTSTYVYDDKSEEKVCKVFGAENYISYDQNNMTWCILCDWILDVSVVTKHINGEHHQTILDLHKKRLTALQMKNSNYSYYDNEQQKIIALDYVNKFQVPEKKGTLVARPVFLKPGGVEQPLQGNSPKSSKVPKDCKDTASSGTFLDVETHSSPKIKKTKDPMSERMPLKDFVETIAGVKNVIFKDIVINNKFCINTLSFGFIAFVSEKVRMKCYVCDENILYTAFESHSDSPKHERAMKDSLILTQHDTEFIREMQSGSFHCGYCNIFEKSWNEIEDHLKTSLHIECKNNAFWRLQQYQPVFLQNMSQKTTVDSFCTNMTTVKFL